MRKWSSGQGLNTLTASHYEGLIEMLDAPEKEPGRLIPWIRGFDPDVIEFSLACVPDWVPSEYREFFNSYVAFEFEYGEWFAPNQPPSDPSSAQAGYSSLREAAEAFGADPDAWFPVGMFDGDDYVAYHRKDDGAIEFGRYHFLDREFLDGPYPSMAEWMQTYGVEL